MKREKPPMLVPENIRLEILRSDITLVWTEHIICADLMSSLGLSEYKASSRKSMMRFNREYELFCQPLRKEVDRVAGALTGPFSGDVPVVSLEYQKSIGVFRSGQSQEAFDLLGDWFAGGVNAWDFGRLPTGLFVAGFWCDSSHRK